MYYFLTTIGYLFSFFPTCILVSFAWVLGVISFDILRIRRKVVLKNLRIAFPNNTEKQNKKIGRRCYYNFGLTGLEVLTSVRKDITANIDLINKHYAIDALDKDMGLFIICGHLGNWEAMGAKVGKSIRHTLVIVKKVGGDGTNRFISTRRLQNGFDVIESWRKGEAYKLMLRTLKVHSDVVGYVCDQSMPDGPRLPFFTETAKTNTTLATAWLRHSCPVLPATIRRVSFGKHVLEFFPELKLDKTDNPEEDILRISTQINKAMEDMIIKAPEQYFWLHNRWK